jgi:hypothetical protein
MNSKEKILQNISRNIFHQKENTIWNHFKNCFWKFNHDYSGNINPNGFTLWRYSHWVGIFYPIITGEFVKQNDKQILQLRSKINPLVILIFTPLYLFLFYGIITGIIIQEDNSWKFLWKRILAGIFLFSLFLIAPVLSYRSQRKSELNKIKSII